MTEKATMDDMKRIEKGEKGFFVATKIDRRRFDVLIPFCEFDSEASALKDAVVFRDNSSEMRRIHINDSAIVVQDRQANENFAKGEPKYIYTEKEFAFDTYNGSRANALIDAKKYRDRMRFISEVPTGFIVRKTIEGKVYQTFFGTEAHGGRELALESAMEHRDQVVEWSAGYRTVQEDGDRTATGVAGVVWHCKPNKSRDNKIVHAFRGQAPNPESEGATLYKGLSIQRYGLWNAYYALARWRLAIIASDNQGDAYILERFKRFMAHYLELLASETPDLDPSEPEEVRRAVIMEMKDALVGLASDPGTPREVIALLPNEIRARFDKTKNRPVLVADKRFSA